MAQLVIIPGLGDSGEKHWQSLWLKKFDRSIKIVQDNWDEPTLDQWVNRLNEVITKVDGSAILVAHSLAVSLVAHWAKVHKHTKVKGALLVAPADVDSPDHTPDVCRGFAPMPTARLPFPSLVVASDNDTFVSIPRAQYFAESWGSDFVNVGPKGHINSDSNLGLWEEGQINLTKLM